MPKEPEIYTCDILIIGGGIAGLTAALTASKFGSVILLTKGKTGESATEKAQGGIAAAIDQPKDSPAYHLQDTLAAGAGLCDEKAVEILVKDGVERVKELIEMGTQFDRGEVGFELTIEGAHRKRRILHAGDATGEEIERTLGRNVLKECRVDIRIFTFGKNLLLDRERCIGATALDILNNKTMIFKASATILATGGLGQVYLYTTNPLFATGDGIAMAYRAGAEISDLEFIQFHPTALVQFKELENIIALPQFLISEAVRGEGGILLNSKGERFMHKYHKQAELAPRDIVARAIVEEMKKTKTDHVFLSLSKIESANLKKRFPTIYMTCLEHGIDITHDHIPVAPAAHYCMGGIKTDLEGRTNIPGLYAAGEAASTGVHGANRLASNSLLEGLVFGRRAAENAREYIAKMKNARLHRYAKHCGQGKLKDISSEDFKQIKKDIKKTMWENVGIVRSGKGLQRAIKKLAGIEKKLNCASNSYKELELSNMVLVSKLIAQAASARLESRGAHYRTDYPERDDKNWKRHLVYRAGPPATSALRAG